MFEIQKFKESKLPALPFTLQLESDYLDENDRFQLGIGMGNLEIEGQSVTNKATNEQLSISKERKQIWAEVAAEVAAEPEDQGLYLDLDMDFIEIKRAKKEKKDAQAK